MYVYMAFKDLVEHFTWLMSLFIARFPARGCICVQKKKASSIHLLLIPAGSTIVLGESREVDCLLCKPANFELRVDKKKFDGNLIVKLLAFITL